VGEERLKKCIIMHVLGGICGKLHYSAVFGGGKNEEKALNAESAEERFEEE
jgi:hypothetical protein